MGSLDRRARTGANAIGRWLVAHPRLSALAAGPLAALGFSPYNLWPLALAALKPEGGWLHLHGNAPGGDEEAWGDSVVKELREMDSRPVTVERLVKVKWYAPHVRHCVLDLSIG